MKYHATEATGEANSLLQVMLSYRALTASDGGTSIAAGVTGVKSELYADTALTQKLGDLDGDGTALSVAKNGSAEVWLSLKGEPMVNGNPFTSQNLIPIGMLTIALAGFTTDGGN